ncbi:TPA: hypothetical protein RQL13_001680 [Vibrio vulnificus]|uniref:hypothetical protein n=1 Tax=Vibrio vulnificus TaxID=672 RepID=UPI001A18E08E|nr:hypothetical protein [Vibrio vulnificus]MCA0759193.1 hypothetical protein [Vibrio vulnificus]HAS6182147.1 hypothetical protein [Vibrio vulnificus]HAS6252030.1 hypothetical protein [Vibrio vulnificus]HAT8547868.1 hypothetical protein [Vibrio vulnificus]HDY7730250.1 hypothetical protein [Vibrio vulnificus]
MNNNKKITVASVLVLFSSFALSDEKMNQEEAPDPGDHTKVSSVINLTYGKQSFGEQDNDFAQIQGQVSGKKSNENLFLGQLTVQGREGGKVGSEDFNLSQVRARYFEVSHTDWEHAPMVGVSLDYIETSFTDAVSDRLFAIGGLIRVNTPFKNWLSFPILAAAVGKNNNTYSRLGLVDDYSYGVQFNFLNSIYLNKNGTHIQVNPQFSSLDFGGSVGTVNQLQLDLAFQAPFTDDRKHWGKVTYTEFFDDTEQSFGHNRQGTELKFTYSYYF